MSAKTLSRLVSRLGAQYDAAGCWRGRLSSSALAGAVACFALARVDRAKYDAVIRSGLDWIVADANRDGGWGDSPQSPSNISATLLCLSALTLTAGEVRAHDEALNRAQEWIRKYAGGCDPASVRAAVLERYGSDRTFATPILMMCALAGRLGTEPRAWELVPQLPFELAVFPHGFYRRLRLTVVSYALPALIAVGLVRHRRLPSPCSLRRFVRDRCVSRLLAAARRMQPANGGYEEAVPLTGFVVLGLAAAGHADHEIVRAGTSFLLATVRENGSWPIDTTLATWVTTLTVNSVSGTVADAVIGAGQASRIRDWLLAQQCGVQHPLTFGGAGGWAWSDRPGAMPDADDTSGVLLALRRLGNADGRTVAAATQGIEWLLRAQNRDGGIPTFSRGWGRLPFDRSCPDISAHALQAFQEWKDDMRGALRIRVERSMRRILRYLSAAQNADGSWVPLWFGNQWTDHEENPVYGTARVVSALRAISHRPGTQTRSMVRRGSQWLGRAQNPDGGWGGARGAASSLEETGVAAASLARGGYGEAVRRGVAWIIQKTQHGELTPAAPIGLYFARLWYCEEMYPLILVVSALARIENTE